jgi:hypothetical protein
MPDDQSLELFNLRARVQRLHLVLTDWEKAISAEGVEGGNDQPQLVQPFLKARREPAVPLRAPRSAPNPLSWLLDQPPAFALRPSAGWANASTNGNSVGTTAVLVFGRRGTSLKQALEIVANVQSRTAKFVPLFLTDTSHHYPFEREGYAFEYFPPAAYRSAAGMDAEKVAARIRFVGQKWNVTNSMNLSTFDAPQKLPTDTDISFPPPPVTKPPVANDPVDAIRRSGLFDEAWYLVRNPDVAASGMNPIKHYLEVGAERGRDPHPLFETVFYAMQMLHSQSGDQSR